MNKISVIVPVYNGENHLHKSIDSLLKQTIEVDIIVINDGSTDKTKEILEAYAEKHRNIHVFNKENEGIAETRNYGISKVETEYFGFLDADDSCKPEMYETLLNKIEEENSDIVFSNFEWVYPDGSRKFGLDINYKDKRDILVNMKSILWDKLYRTSWFKDKNIMFPKGLKYEDSSVLCRLAYYMDKVSYVDKTFVDYNQVQGSITHTFNVNVNDMIEVFKGIKDFYEGKGYDEEVEYLTTRFFLGSSYLRACRIKDGKLRKETLDKAWNYLINSYPDFNKNRYLNNSGLKNRYYKLMNKTMYYSNAYLFRFLYRIGVMK